MRLDEYGRAMCVFAFSSRSSDVYHVMGEDGHPSCGVRIADHHKEWGLLHSPSRAGWVRCTRPGCKEVSDAE
jgi:hypothetical protein